MSVVAARRLTLAASTSGRTRIAARVPASARRLSFTPKAMGILDGLGKVFGGGEKTENSAAARAGKRGCELAPATAPEGLEIATVAGGCFWGLELAYQRLPGVVKTSVGYIGGRTPNPTYEEVCSGGTGHAEAVQMYYKPEECSYDSIMDCFFKHVDPTTLNRQGNDAGTQYRSVVYYHTEEQKAAAEKAVAAANEALAKGTFRPVVGKKVVTTIEPATDYYLAEDYHQQYLSRGGRFNRPQDASKGATEKIRCYG